MNKNISSGSQKLPEHFTKDYHQIIDALSACIYLKDKEGVYLDCNEYMIKLAGFQNREQIIGKTDYEMPWKKQADRRKVLDLLTISYNKPSQLEEKIEDSSGQVRNFLTSKAPLLDEQGKIIGIIGISVDITDKKMIEQQLGIGKKSSEKFKDLSEKPVSNLANAVRVRLRVIVKNARILEEKWFELDDRQRYQFIVIIAQFSKRLAKFIDNVSQGS